MTCVLAINKIWHPSLAENLETRTQNKFHTISCPTQLTDEILSDINPKYIFFPHWSNIIPAEIYKKFECVIFHMTDLPFGRGGSPLQNLIARKIYQTKITALRCEENLDSGPVYLKKPLSLHGRAQDIYFQATLIIEDMIVDIIKNKLTPVAQEGEIVTFQRRKPEQSNIEKLDDLTSIYDSIRMLDADGYPKAFLETEHYKLEFSHAVINNDEIQANVKIILKRENND